MPVGYLITIGVWAAATALALRPVRRTAVLATISFGAGMIVNGLPVLIIAGLAIATAPPAVGGDLRGPAGAAALGAALVTVGGLVVVIVRGMRARGAVRRALADGLGPAAPPVPRMGPGAAARTLLTPLPLWARGIRRRRGIRYGPARRGNRLDVYAAAGRPHDQRPVFVHFHGGHFRSGGRSREARAILHRLARRGWLCVSADYRLRAAGRFPASLTDAKRVVAWIRENSATLGADPDRIVVAGSSAGAHLATMTALTPGEPDLQPGFPAADTSVAGVVGLYGYYGPRDQVHGMRSSPAGWVGPAAPPVLLLHGDADTIVPVAAARSFARALRAVSEGPVVLAELPGGQHGFDLFRSPRCAAAVDAVEIFVTHTVAAR